LRDRVEHARAQVADFEVTVQGLGSEGVRHGVRDALGEADHPGGDGVRLEVGLACELTPPVEVDLVEATPAAD